MYQNIEIIGHLTRDPEMGNAGSSTVCNFSVATNRRWKNQDGTQGEETIYFRVAAWRGLGDVCYQYLKQGRQVFVVGQLVPDQSTGGPRVYQKSDGTYGSSFEIRADKVVFLGSRGETVEHTEDQPF